MPTSLAFPPVTPSVSTSRPFIIDDRKAYIDTGRLAFSSYVSIKLGD